jgi:hypothetical protein
VHTQLHREVEHAFTIGASPYASVPAIGFPVLAILNLGGTIGREPIAETIVNKEPRFKGEVSTLPWQGRDLELVIVRQTVMNTPVVTFNVLVPLKPKAIVLKLSGPADREPLLHQLLTDTVNGLQGDASW